MSRTTTATSSSSKAITVTDKAVYLAPTGELQLDVQVDSETVWLTQAQLAELFNVRVPTINEHLANIYGESELERKTTIRNFRIVRQEGRRQWATRVLRERLIGTHRQRQLEQARWQGLGHIVFHVENKDEARALLDVIGPTQIRGGYCKNTTRTGYLPSQTPHNEAIETLNAQASARCSSQPQA